MAAAQEENGHRVVLSLLSFTDDTVLMGKKILKEVRCSGKIPWWQRHFLSNYWKITYLIASLSLQLNQNPADVIFHKYASLCYAFILGYVVWACATSNLVSWCAFGF